MPCARPTSARKTSWRQCSRRVVIIRDWIMCFYPLRHLQNAPCKANFSRWGRELRVRAGHFWHATVIETSIITPAQLILPNPNASCNGGNVTQIPRLPLGRPSYSGSGASGDVRTSAQEGAKPRRTPSEVIKRAGEIHLAQMQPLGTNWSAPRIAAAGFVAALEEARDYGLRFAVAQAKVRARMLWNRPRLSLAIFNTQAPACRTSFPGR
jgi:hypothetical protein